MYKVYVIQNNTNDRLYVGFSNNVDRRLKEHNSGNVFSTKGYCPWRLVYSESVNNRIEARKREKYLKSGCGKEFLKSFLMPR